MTEVLGEVVPLEFLQPTSADEYLRRFAKHPL
jgi:hypothetical protein